MTSTVICQRLHRCRQMSSVKIYTDVVKCHLSNFTQLSSTVICQTIHRCHQLSSVKLYRDVVKCYMSNFTQMSSTVICQTVQRCQLSSVKFLMIFNITIKHFLKFGYFLDFPLLEYQFLKLFLVFSRVRWKRRYYYIMKIKKFFFNLLMAFLQISPNATNVKFEYKKSKIVINFFFFMRNI